MENIFLTAVQTISDHRVVIGGLLLGAQAVVLWGIVTRLWDD